MLGTLASAFVQAGRYDFSWSGRVWRLEGGAPDLALTVQPWIWQLRAGKLEAPILASRGILRSSSGEQVPCTLLVDGESLEASSVLLESGGRASVFDLHAIREADPEVVFSPVVSAVDLRAGAPSDLAPAAGVPIPASGRLALRQAPAEPGDYLVQVRAADVWGNQRDALFPVVAR